MKGDEITLVYWKVLIQGPGGQMSEMWKKPDWMAEVFDGTVW